MASSQQAVRTRQDPEQRRQQILEEATWVIGERGYYGFSIKELAQRCKLTNAGLLHYFGSKVKLLIALLEDRDRRDREAVTSIIGLIEGKQNQSLPTVVKSLHAIVQRNSTQPELVRLFAVLRVEALDEGHPAREYFLSREAETLRIFAEMVEPYVQHPHSTARQLSALMAGLEQQWLRGGQQFDLVAEWDCAVAQFLPKP